jgi:hypothetical protein
MTYEPFNFDPTVTTHLNHSLFAIHNPDHTEWCSVDLPIHMWFDVSTAARILVLTSSQQLAKKYLELTRRMEMPCETRRDYMTLYNVEGGSIFFGSWGCSIGARRFDYVICSDPQKLVPLPYALGYLATGIIPRVIP